MSVISHFLGNTHFFSLSQSLDILCMCLSLGEESKRAQMALMSTDFFFQIYQNSLVLRNLCFWKNLIMPMMDQICCRLEILHVISPFQHLIHYYVFLNCISLTYTDYTRLLINHTKHFLWFFLGL